MIDDSPREPQTLDPNSHPVDHWQKSCVHAARIGGEILKRYQGRITTREKSPKDLVTEADLASQRAIETYLTQRFPAHVILGEESDPAELDAAATSASDRVRWIIDPLDGTTNYVHQLPNYCVSVGVERAGVIWAGAVYDPVADECFHAGRGRGAWLNQQRVQVSSCRQLRDALVAVSFSAGIQAGNAEVARFERLLYRSQAIRRLGSAALNLCYVATGRLDAYVASSVKPWDVAAGVLLIEEAGGRITGLDGSSFDLDFPHLAAAASEPLHAELSAVLRHNGEVTLPPAPFLRSPEMQTSGDSNR